MSRDVTWSRHRSLRRWTTGLLGMALLATSTAAEAGSHDARPGITVWGRRERSQREETSSVPSSPAPSSSRPSPSDERDTVWLTSEVDDRDPYVGEQTVLTIRLVSAARIYHVEFKGPELVGLTQARPFQESDYSTTQRGVSVHVHEYRAPLFPMRPGPVEVGSASFTCRIKMGGEDDASGSIFDDFYSGRSQEQSGRSEPIRIEARGLPGGAPAGPIGKTEVTAALAPTSVKKGEPATLSIEVKTFGLDSAVTEPRLAGLENFQVVGDRPVTEWLALPDGRFQVRKVFKLGLLGRAAGSFSIPPVSVSFVDPETGQVKETASAALSLRVGRSLPGAKGAPTRGSPRSAGDEGEVIRSIQSTPPTVLVENPLAGPGWGGWALALAGTAGSAGSGWWVGRRRRAAEDPAGERVRSAVRKAKRDLAGAERAITETTPVFYENLGRVIRDFVGNKLDLPAGVLVPEELEARLRSAGADAATSGEARELLALCELRRWSRASDDPAGRRDGIERTKLLIARLDGALTRGNPT